MTAYLALDFGTTNCVAGEISDKLELNLVPLEDISMEMPSAIFLKSQFLTSSSFDDVEFELRVSKAIKDETEKQFKSLVNIEKNLNDFYLANRPRVREPDRKYTSYENRHLRFVENSLLEKTLEYFKDNELKLERSRLLANLPAKKSEEQIRSDVKALMYQEIMESDIQILQEETFFTALLNPDTIPLFGNDAIKQYTEKPLSGFFMRSPKAFLAANLSQGQTELFIRVVTLIIKHIKVKSELYFKKEFTGVVIGRPVNYIGANAAGSNEIALEIMRKAAVRAGFNLVRFVMEPLAAALVIGRNVFSSDEPLMVVDVGGGTTDVAYLGVTLDGDVKLTVKGIAGERIGGNDFDESIALNKFGPFIGREYRFANSIIIDALSTRDIHSQAKFRKSGEDIYSYLKKDNNILTNRLYQIYRNQLQHQIIIFSEKLKINLSNKENVSELVRFLPPDFNLELSSRDISIICMNHLSVIKKNIQDAIPEDLKKNPVRIFLTGGMSGFHPLVSLVKDTVPAGSTLRRISALHSIVAGLSVVARRLSLSEGAFDEPDIVRGIPVLK